MNMLLPSNQQQVIEQAGFTYFPLGKAFEKQIKTIEDQGKKQVDASENQNQKSKQNRLWINLTISQKLQLYLVILSAKEKKMSKLYDSVDYNNLKFGYIGPTKGVSFYKYMDSK